MTKSWNVSYSCRVKGCRWVTSKKKALLCISPNLLSVVLPSDTTCSTTRLLVRSDRASPSCMKWCLGILRYMFVGEHQALQGRKQAGDAGGQGQHVLQGTSRL